jgi:adenosylcobinamide-GDP ribazoletransferase
MSRDGLRLSVTLLSILPESIVPTARPPGSRPGPDQADLPRPAWVARSAGPADGFDELGGPPWGAAEPPAYPPRAESSSPLAGPSRQSAAEAMLWAPVIGLVLGAIAAAVLYVFGHLLHTGSLVAAVLAVGSLAVLSRGLHLDGLADLADAAGRGVPAIIVAAVTGRLAITWACRRGVPSARPDGLGAMVAGSVAPVTAAVLTVVALAVTVGGIFLAAAVADVPVQWILPVAVGAGLVTGIALGEHAARRLGGVTGDVLGAVSEAATAACLLVTAIS